MRPRIEADRPGGGGAAALKARRSGASVRCIAKDAKKRALPAVLRAASNAQHLAVA
jgi:hypothetical protein